ncbi:hypothetical protein BWP39_11925 [Paraburkholderia acidicola]|uniref:Uncharacterized protein n=2 Tax=Paraburkholderia acidicola TaxID=1912599 RepID=A0A2A4EWJ5_9BURK|nr:hypothetical protein BWP39_11925 [Paraburkholderia acidicola]
MALLAAILSLGKVSAPRPLVVASGWTETGLFPPLKDAPSALQVPQTMLDSPGFAMWRTWSSTGATKGTIESPPFKAPHYMAVPFQRGGNRGYVNADEINLECKASGRRLIVSSLQTFDEWSVAYVSVPASFCASEVSLIAVSNAAAPDSYLGIATPFEVSRATYLANSGFGVKQMIVAATMLVLLVIFFASHVIVAGFRKDVDAFGAGMIGVGIAGMIVFSAAAINPVLARATGVAILASSIWLCAWGFAKGDLRTVWNQHRTALTLWLAAAMCLTSFVAGIDNGGGRWAVNAMFSPLSWSTDNENPIVFAQALAHSYGPMLAGPWFLDDRTPLLTVLLIIPQTLFIEPIAELVGSDFVYNADGIAGIAILTMWIPVVAWFATKIEVRHRTFFVALVLLSPFALFNTLYIWGKMLGAGYILLAVGLMLSVPVDPDRPRSNLSLIPSALALSYLAHSGNAIAAIAFLIVFFPVLRVRDWRILLVGTLLALAVMAPWQIWTTFVQPHGNALTRFQLANDVGFDHRAKSVLTSMLETLRATGWGKWFQMKRFSFHLLGDVPGNVVLYRPIDNRSPSWLGNQRAKDFAVLARTVGIPMLGVLPALVAWIRGKADPLVTRLIWCGFLGIVAMTLLIIQIAVVHHMAYGSVILLAIAGSMYLANRASVWPKALFIAYCLYGGITWIVDPITHADHLHVAPLIYCALWGIVGAYAAMCLPACKVNHQRLWETSRGAYA